MRIIIEPKIQIEESRKKFSNRQLIALIVPIIAEQLLMTLVGIVDTMMISYAGEEAVSGVSLVNQINMIFVLGFSALATGGAVVISQYVGKGDKENGSLAIGQLTTIAVLLSVVMMTVVLSFHDNILKLLYTTVDDEIFNAANTYLVILSYSYPFLAIYNAMAGMFRSIGNTQITMKISLVMNVVNVFGNALGIFVLNIGVAGVAYASLISRIVAALAMVILATDDRNPVTLKPRYILICDWNMIKRILHIAIPNTLENTLQSVSKVLLSMMLATFGTMQISAYGVAQTYFGMSALFCLGMVPAFTTVIGQYMGIGDEEGAEYYIKKLLRLTYLGGFIWDFVWIILTPVLMNFYSISVEGKILVIIMVIIHNVFDAVINPYAFSLTGGLRAAGDVQFTMIAAIFGSVVCRVTFAYFFGVILKWGAIGITLAMVADWFVKGGLIIIRYYTGKWKGHKVI